MHFWSIKGVYILQNANNLNFELYFRLYTWPTKQVFCLYLRIILDNESFWMNCSLNQSFWRLKKSSTSCPNWGGNTFVHSANSALSLSPSTTSLLPIMRAWRVWYRIEVLVDIWKTTVRRCLYIDLLLLLVFGQAPLLSRHREETREKKPKSWFQIFYFPTFCWGQSHFYNDNEKTQHTIENNFCNKRENPT